MLSFPTNYRTSFAETVALENHVKVGTDLSSSKFRDLIADHVLVYKLLVLQRPVFCLFSNGH